MLWANPSITVPMLLALAVMDSLMRGILTSVSWIVVQSVLVILFVSRAKGKEASFEQAFSMFNQRAGRIFWSLFKCTLKIWFLVGLGTVVLGGAAALGAGGGASTGIALILIVPGAYILWYGVRKYFAYSFVAIVAALGPDEEPKDPLERSEELFHVDKKQVLYAPFVFALLTLPVMFVGGVCASVFDSGGHASFFLSTNPGDWIAALMMNSLLLCWVMYLVLFYLEARKVLQASSLPFTPEEFVPSQGQR
ncbi:MAG: hypothetical protein HY303_06385 [Candidatus Wallbacteria bacterium]|nr:hypothetical protein [Candidatus Wallbacteria bacterium]